MSGRLALLLRHLAGPSSSVFTRSASGYFVSRSAGSALTASAAQPGQQSSMVEPSTAARNAARPVHTAACLIIGDEVLGGKTKDTNSAYVAKWCFKLGISLKRIEVVEDDESQIIEAVRRMSDGYDFVVTSGGIGPTHDDITYASIAKAFGLPIRLYDEAYRRMRKLSKPRPGQPPVDWDVDSPALRARLRMVELPTDASVPAAQQFLFPREDLWVPVCVVHGNVHILPGVPRLFEMLLDALEPVLRPRLAGGGSGIHRVLISTPLGESLVAPYLTELAARVEPQGVKVGSYPRWERQHNTVTLVGRDAAVLERLVPEVLENVQGRRIAAEGEDEEAAEEAGKPEKVEGVVEGTTEGTTEYKK